MSLGLSQHAMADLLTQKKAPVYPGHVSEFENGRREPSLLALLGYSRAAKISVDVLIDDNLDLL
jgi:hypothetical protein